MNKIIMYLLLNEQWSGRGEAIISITGLKHRWISAFDLFFNGNVFVLGADQTLLHNTNVEVQKV